MTQMKPVKLSYTCCVPQGRTIDDCNSSGPIILHHGFSSCKERWKPIQQLLADSSKRPVYAIDARNHGASERSDIFNFDILSYDLEHFMESKNIGSAHMIGHSMGGLVVMLLALRAPEKVLDLVIEDVSPKELEPEMYYVFSALIKEQMKCFEQSTASDTEGTMNQKLRESIFRTVPMIPDADHEVIQTMEFPMKKTENGFESLTHFSPLLKALENPPICNFPKNKTYDDLVLFIYGGQSGFNIYDDKDMIKKIFPRALFSCYDEAGHEVCARCPEQYVKELMEFFFLPLDPCD